jgi:hypothetical protein
MAATRDRRRRRRYAKVTRGVPTRPVGDAAPRAGGEEGMSMVRAWKPAAAAALLLALGAAPALAQTAPASGLTTSGLADLCGANAAADATGAASVAFCRGFLISAGQYHAELTQGASRRPPVFCLPGAAPTMEAAQAAFVTWARANPQHGGDKALVGLMRWAASAYPCPEAPARAARR